jgi:hypothetical protein
MPLLFPFEEACVCKYLFFVFGYKCLCASVSVSLHLRLCRTLCVFRVDCGITFQKVNEARGS